jgi:PKD repeat protein
LNSNRFNFINNSTPGSGKLVYQWDFGDSSYSSLKQPIHSFLNTGKYKVSLKIINDNLCKDTFSSFMEIIPSPKAKFTFNPLNACPGTTYHFINASTLSKGTLSYLWNNGNGSFFNSENLDYSFAIGGLYRVSLTAISDLMCKDSMIQLVTVWNNPLTPIINGDTLVYKHSYKSYSVTNHAGSFFNWMITGDSAHTNSSNQVMIYWGNADNGMVNISEVNTNGCLSDTTHLSIRVVPKTSLNELDLMNQLQVYPNPASDQLRLSGAIHEINRIQLISIDGREVRVFYSYQIQTGLLDLSDLDSGIYLLYLTDNQSQHYSRKLSVVK